MNKQSEILCKHCKQWSKWNGNERDKCTHCDAVLRPISKEDQDSIKKRLEVNFLKVPIHDDDNFFVRGFKHVFNFVQLIFVAIISFFLWLFVASPA